MPQIPAINNRPIRLGVLISGGGTTLLNFLNCIREGSLNAEVAVVISSQPDCKGVQRSIDAGLNCITVSRKEYSSTADFSGAVFDHLRTAKVDLVTLAGYLNLLSIPDDFALKVLNIHPSLIPSFCGKGMYGHHVHEAVVNRGTKISGCSVHFADNEYDQGPIVLQRSVEIPDYADADTVASLVFEQEKLAYPEAIRRYASGNLSVESRRTFYSARR